MIRMMMIMMMMWFAELNPNDADIHYYVYDFVVYFNLFLPHPVRI